MKIEIEKAGTTPIFEQGIHSIKRMVGSGTLAPGSRLPSIRAFADSNKISPSTAQRIYDTLEEEGIIIKVPGKGCFVSDQPASASDEFSAVQVFWSYAHKDNDNTNGAISRLLEDIRKEYEVQTGNKLSVFVDTDIQWGSDWKKSIADAAYQTTFFIPILTPTYLRRPNCLSELRNAKRLFEEAGIEKGIYPIRFVNIDRALTTFPDDELANLIHNIQGSFLYKNDARNPTSIRYQAEIGKIVQELIAMDDEQRKDQESIAQHVLSLDSSEQGGILEDLASLEDESSKQIDALSNIESDFTLVGELVSAKTSELKQINQSQSFAKRLAITKELARELEKPAARIYSNCGEFTSGMARMGKGVWAYIDLVKTVNPDSRSEGFESTIKEAAESAHQTFSQIKTFDEALQTAEKLSRELRSPIGKIRSGIDSLLSTDQIFSSWEKGIDELD